MNRPERRNALSTALLTELTTRAPPPPAASARRDPRGQRSGVLGRPRLRRPGRGRPRVDRDAARHVHTRDRGRCRALPQPVVARVHGLATAAGCQLVASADLAVASDRRRRSPIPGGKGGWFCHTPLVAVARAVCVEAPRARARAHRRPHRRRHRARLGTREPGRAARAASTTRRSSSPDAPRVAARRRRRSESARSTPRSVSTRTPPTPTPRRSWRCRASPPTRRRGSRRSSRSAAPRSIHERGHERAGRRVAPRRPLGEPPGSAPTSATCSRSWSYDQIFASLCWQPVRRTFPRVWIGGRFAATLPPGSRNVSTRSDSRSTWRDRRRRSMPTSS